MTFVFLKEPQELENPHFASSWRRKQVFSGLKVLLVSLNDVNFMTNGFFFVPVYSGQAG